MATRRQINGVEYEEYHCCTKPGHRADHRIVHCFCSHRKYNPKRIKTLADIIGIYVWADTWIGFCKFIE